ncbi:hypothetical protein O3P69_002098 [Scylla paramamosain]|uniref:Uncharacterized protein n=1 Tax=Scylla paramamosain TaxID=85552 RepID=A0AAW0V4U0_SCYPA
MPHQLRPVTSPSMTRGASLLKWSFVFIILTGCASSSLEDTRPQDETNKSYKPASNNLTGSSEPAPRLPPTPENCSDHSQLGSVVCPENQQCHELSKECLKCDFNCTCVYGQEVNVTCRPRVSCKGKQEITVPMICRYCYQTSHWEHTCLGNNQCRAVHSPRETFTSWVNLFQDTWQIL